MADQSKFNFLLQAALTGYRSLEWLPIFVARFSMGLFFCVSGYNKLFIVEKHEDLIKLMAKIGLPLPDFMALFLGSVEFFGGIFLMIGLLNTLCAIALTIAMIVAIITVEIDLIIPKGIGFFDWMSWFLYLPQVMYVIIFIWLMTTGPGRFSIDHIIVRKMVGDITQT